MEKENKEVEKEEVYNLKKSKSSKSGIILLLIIIIAVVVCILYSDNITDFFKEKFSKENNDIQLNYTQTSNVNSDGVYITDVSEVVENVMPSIVAITSKTLISSGYFGPNFNWSNQNQYTEGAGSGIIINKTDTKLYILTNNHVVEGSSELIVQFINEKSVEANIVGTSERKDLAVISIELNQLDDDTINAIKIATIGNSDELKVGNGIIAIGNALGYGQSVTTGVVSALNREVSIDNYTNEMIQIDAAINGGNSGGALLNSKGEVVGINSAKYSSSGSSTEASVEGMGFAIPISDVKDLIEDLINGKEDASEVTLGVEGYMTNSKNFQGYNLPLGFYISNIVSGSNAENSDLEVGNIITKIDNKDIESFSDLSDVIYEKKLNDTALLTIQYKEGNNYKEKEITVKFSK